MELLTNTYHIHRLPLRDPEQFVELDMGCGKGGFTLALAARYPQRLVLGNDVMIGRLAAIDRKRERLGLQNLQLLRAESLQLVSFQLPVHSVDRVHLLCPDPWPKKNHVGHRLVCMDFLCRLPRILKPGAILHMSTDYAPYFEVWLDMLAKCPWLEDCPDGAADISDLKTDFERQWLALGCPVRHLTRKLRTP